MAKKDLAIGAGAGVVATAAIYAIGKTVKYFIDKNANESEESDEETEDTEE